MGIFLYLIGKKIAVNPQKPFFVDSQDFLHFFSEFQNIFHTYLVKYQQTFMYLYDNRGPQNPSEFDNPLPEPTEPTVCQYGLAEPTLRCTTNFHQQLL